MTERREPGAGFAQDELDENAKWAKAHNEFDILKWEPRNANVVLESLAVKLDALNRTMTSINRAIWIVFGALVALIVMLR